MLQVATHQFGHRGIRTTGKLRQETASLLSLGASVPVLSFKNILPRTIVGWYQDTYSTFIATQ